MSTLEIEFDSAKEAANIAKHRLSLAKAQALLEGFCNVRIDDRFAYGEARMVAIGLIGDRVHSCVYTMRGPVYRIISLRKANRREVDAYRKS